jgi:hypothetical protein
MNPPAFLERWYFSLSYDFLLIFYIKKNMGEHQITESKYLWLNNIQINEK